MSDRSARPEPADGLPDRLPQRDLTPEFRVVAHNNQRRGIRLERGFWEALKQIANRDKRTLGALVDEVAATMDENGNLASALRVACLRDANRESVGLRQLVSLGTVNAILAACPAPAFALESTRKILAFNPPFQNLVRRQLPVGPHDDGRKDLKLALDINVADIFERLRHNGNQPVATGFVIGADERRYRGQINAARAPIATPELLMAFVVNG